jgi:hypothetical protein
LPGIPRIEGTIDLRLGGRIPARQSSLASHAAIDPTDRTSRGGKTCDPHPLLCVLFLTSADKAGKYAA